MLKGMMASAIEHHMITPSRQRIDKNTTFQFSQSVGAAPIVWSLGAGSVGSINAATGLFTSTGTAGPVHVISTDAASITALSYCYVADAISLDQAGTFTSLEAGQSSQFTASNGVPPYVFRSLDIDTSQASLDTATGILTIDSSITASGSLTVSVVDDFGDDAGGSASVSFIPAVNISPTSGNVKVNDTQQFYPINGLDPFTWSVVSGSGSIDVNGLYTAPATGIGSAVIVRVTSAAGSHSDATMTLISDLALAPNHAPETILKNTTRQFTASLGTAPYTYSLVSGIGSINGTGLYTAPNSIGNAVIRVTDAHGDHVDETLNISPLIDRSVMFDGVDDYLDAGNCLSFEKTDAFSVSFWFYLSSAAFGSGSEIAIINRTNDLGSGSFKGWSIIGLSAWYLQLAHDYNAGNYLEVQFLPNNLAVSGWNHMVLTYDGSATGAGTKFYLNTVSASQGYADEDLTASIVVADHCEIGRMVAELYQTQGNLCSLSAFSTVLSQTDVNNLYNGGEPGDVTAHAQYGNCLTYWKLGQGDTYPNLTDTKSGHTAVMTNQIAGDIVVGAAP